MTVYHMGKDGSPKVCKALKGTCPLGGEHFGSLAEARTYAEVKAAEYNAQGKSLDYEDIFSVSQRRRMFSQNPKMSYIHPVGTVLISKRGDLWELIEREQTGGQLDHRFTLQNRRSAKKVIVSTSFERASGERAPEDFAQLIPEHFTVDGPPRREGTGLELLPPGKTNLANVLIAKVRVNTVENALDKELPRFYDEFGGDDPEEERRVYGRNLDEPKYRYLVVKDSNRSEINDPKKRDLLSLALWRQAGRDDADWDRLSPQERANLLMDSKNVSKASFFNKNGSTNFTNGDLRPDQFDSFWLPGGTPTSSISVFKPDLAEK